MIKWAKLICFGLAFTKRLQYSVFKKTNEKVKVLRKNQAKHLLTMAAFQIKTNIKIVYIGTR